MKLLVFLLLPCLSLSEVVPGFGKCRHFFLNKDPPAFTPSWGKAVQEICQCLEDKTITYHYATLYNPDWRIPIYSAYVFDGSKSVGRDDRWYIEPQLDDPTAEPWMAPKGHNKVIGKNQAVNDDYEGQDLNGPSYDRGHLYPVQHTNTELSMLATSTLTNAAPQDACFNRLQWKNHETVVIEDLKDCDEAYVVTGVVPDLTKIKLNKRVTVSRYYWRAYCCVKTGVYTEQGYFGPDNNNRVQKLSIKALQTQLAEHYGVKTVVIFPSRPRSRTPLTGPPPVKKPRLI